MIPKTFLKVLSGQYIPFIQSKKKRKQEKIKRSVSHAIILFEGVATPSVSNIERGFVKAGSITTMAHRS